MMAFDRSRSLGARVSGLLLVAGLASIEAPATAAEPDEGENSSAPALGEIVVTAQKRSESLQKTPVAVTAFGESDIQRSGLTGPQQLQQQTPSLTYGNNAGFHFITIRGVGSDLVSISGESAVASYVDGVYIGAMMANSLPNYDLERIEVLRGPQGTLYGRNTTGGVINYITKTPSFDAGAVASAAVGNYKAWSTDVGVTGPLTDNIAGRASFHYGRHGGYRKNLALGIREDADRNYSGRASLLFTPSDSFSATIRADIARDRNSNPNQLISLAGLDGASSEQAPLGLFSLPAATLAAIPGLLSPGDIARLNGRSIAEFYGLTQPGPTAPDPTRSLSFSNGSPTSYRTNTGGVSATLVWELPGATIKSISAYRDTHFQFISNTPGLGVSTVLFSPLKQTSEQISQELNLSGQAFDRRVDWLIGGFYFRDDATLRQTVWVPTLGELVQAGALLTNPAAPPALALLPPGVAFPTDFYQAPNPLSTVLADGPDFVGGAPLIAGQSIPSTAFLGWAQDQRTTSLAAFGQATWAVTDELRLTGGIRYTRDRKNVVRSAHSNFLATIGATATLCDAVPMSKTWTATTGTVGADYQITPRILSYAKVSWGYKAGGMSPYDGCASSFDPETVQTEEIGLKSLFADGQLLLNVALYHFKYNDIQFTRYTANGATIDNAASASARGAEVEMVVQPQALEGFRLNFTGSFQDSGYGNAFFRDPALLIPAPGANIKGNQLIRAPKWKATIAPQYTADLGASGSLEGRFEAAYKSTYQNDVFSGQAPFGSGTTQPGFWLLNARLSWVSDDRKFEAQLFGENLTNELYATNRVPFNTPPTLNIVAGQFAPPRTFGLRLTARLGSAR